MKPHLIELPSWRHHILPNIPKLVLLSTLTLILLTIIPFYKYNYPFLHPFQNLTSPSSSSHEFNDDDNSTIARSERECNIFKGEWVPDPEAPYYTNMTCWTIQEHQNCMKYGRPNMEFLKWRWKPDACELPSFDPARFLEMVRGKSLAFVGDSLSRNQMQSLMCLLSRVEYPKDISNTTDENFKHMFYTTYNFTISIFWSPFLIKAHEPDTSSPTGTGLWNLYLDEVDMNWASNIEEYDYVIISSGNWFTRPAIYYEKDQPIGCHYCQIKNVTELTMSYSNRKAFATALRAINESTSFKGMTILRTFSPSHFEDGEWNKGGNCVRTRPFRNNETRLEGMELEVYKAQVEVFREAEREGRRKGIEFRLLDTTEAMLLRPDGHPSRYGHWSHENVTLYNDCVHWCLPGPIDAWNNLLFQILSM